MWQQLSRRTRLSLTVFILLLALVVLRGYLYCGLALLYQYAFWIFASETVQYASPVTVPEYFAEKGVEPPVPRIIHQTWKSRTAPEKWRAAQQSCMDKHPGYEYKLWTDEDAEQLIATKFPWFLPTWNSYPHAIQRADAMRYFVLYEHGGIYLDMDVECLKSLEFLRNFNFTAPKTYPVGVSNDVMVARPKDPFAHRLISNLAAWNKWFFIKYATVMISTGPMFVTVQWVLHDKPDEISVLPADLYGKYKHTDAAYLRHLHGSSWHGNDAGFVFWVEKNGVFAAAMAALVLLTAGLGYFAYGRYYSPQGAGSGSSSWAPGGATGGTGVTVSLLGGKRWWASSSSSSTGFSKLLTQRWSESKAENGKV